MALIAFLSGNPIVSLPGFFRSTGKGLTKPGPSPIPCTGWPVDKRDKPVELRKTRKCDFQEESDFKQFTDRIGFQKLKIVFMMLIVGLGGAVIVFAIEIMKKKC